MRPLRLIYTILFAALTMDVPAQGPFKQSYDVIGDGFTKAYHTNTYDGGMILMTRSVNVFVTPNNWFTVFKTAPNGNLQWSQRFAQPGNCNVSNIVQLPDSSYFFCFVELNSPEKYYITHLDQNGALIYCKSLTPPPDYIVAFDPQCTVGANGNVYIAADLYNQTNNMFGWHLFEISTSGNVIFSNCYNGGTLKCLERGFRLCANGDLLMTGYQRDSLAMHYGPVITRIDSAGTLLWSKLYLDSTTDIAGFSVLEMTNGNIVVTASHTTPGNETVRLETDASGNLIRSREYGNAANAITPVTSLPVENDNMLIFGTSAFGSYALKLDPVGNVLYSQLYTSIVPNRINQYYGGYSFSGVDYATNHAVIFTADTALISCFGDTLAIDTGSISFSTIVIGASYNVALADTAFALNDTLWPGTNLKVCGPVGINEPTSENEIVLYPVPADQIMQVTCASGALSYSIFNVHGQLVAQSSAHNQSIEIYTGNLPCGVYVLRLRTVQGVSIRKFIIDR